MSDTKLKKIVFQGGFNKNTTKYSAENWWVDGDKVRFRNGRPEKIGGWVSEIVEQAEDENTTSFTGVARASHTWTSLQFDKYLAVGTHKKIEIFNSGTIYDVTPYRESNTLSNAITTSSGQSTVTINDTNHGLVAGDYVYVDSQASAVDGITLSGSYVVDSVTDSDNFVIDSGTTATGTTSGGGGNLDINYLLENGYESNGNLDGWGGGYWDTPGSSTITEYTLNNAIDTNGTTTITINHTAHGLAVGDEITVTAQDSAVDGIDLSGVDFTGDFEVATVPNANSYTIVAVNNLTLETVTATGTTSGGGGNLTVQYGGEGWGRERDGVGGQNLRQVSFDNWGEDLLACVKDGKIYQWDKTNGLTTRMQVVSNAPTQNSFIMVAQPSRHLVAFGTQQESGGTFDPLTIRWAAQETLTTWSTTTTNSAGEYRLPLGNYIVSAIQTRSEILVFTDSTVYSMRYVGGNDIFQFDLLADNVGAISLHCGVDVNGVVYWMSGTNFYMYDGVVRQLESTLDEYIFDQDGGGILNFSQKEKVYCETNSEFGEIIFLYPANESDEINRYILFNYLENTWYDGTIVRTIWEDVSVFSKPYAINADGVLYIHETGKDDDGNPMTAYVESGDFDLGDGESLMFVDRFIPDFTLYPNRNAQVYFTTKKYPNSTGLTKGPYVFNNDTNKINVRLRGRHLSIKYEVDTLGSDFEVGSPRIGLQIDGER